jgi:acyl-CoA synthetase (AMP-forming)/AMP-acid ligase II
MSRGLFHLLHDHADADPDAALYTFRTGEGDVALSRRDVVEQALSRRAQVDVLLRPQALVVLAFAPSAELVVTFWAVVAAGAVAVVYTHPRPGQPVEDYLERVARFAAEEGAMAVLSDLEPRTTIESSVPIVFVSAVEGGAAGAPGPASVDEADLAYVQYSSGTTGRPRGAELRVGAVLRHVQHLSDLYRWTDEDTAVGWLPLSHDMGLATQLLLPAFSGTRGVMTPPWQWLRRPATLLQMVSDHRGSLSWMPNFAFKLCLNRIRDDELEGVDLRSWRMLGNGAEVIEPEVLAAFEQRFEPWGLPPRAIIAGYGMSENVVGVAVTEPESGVRLDRVDVGAVLRDGRAEPLAEDDPQGRPVASCGYPMEGTEVAVLRGDGTFGGDRDTGEILVRGDSLFTGYRGLPEATKSAFHEGWYRTGDLGYLADGEVFVLERLDDVMVLGGRNVRPHDIERVVRGVLGDLGNVAVAFSVRDERVGTEAAIVMCELRDLEATDPAPLRRAIRAAVQAELDVAIGDVQFVPRNSIPRTTSGKVARRASAALHSSTAP